VLGQLSCQVYSVKHASYCIISEAHLGRRLTSYDGWCWCAAIHRPIEGCPGYRAINWRRRQRVRTCAEPASRHVTWNTTDRCSWPPASDRRPVTSPAMTYFERQWMSPHRLAATLCSWHRLQQLHHYVNYHRRYYHHTYYWIYVKKTYQFTTVCKDDVVISVL